MSLQPTQDFTIPELTVQVAHAAFPKGNDYMRLRDELGTIFTDAAFATLYPRRGQPAEAPWRLALVTLLQFAERLTDRQAADGVRSRIDWKYLLGLELTDKGFHYSVLCEFRCRLIEGGAEALLFEQLLTLFKARGLLKERGKQRTDSTHIIAAVRKLSRVELVAETVYHALDVLAQVAPDWLQMVLQPEWFERYSQRPTSYRMPRNEAEQMRLAEQVGRDGWYLLQQIWLDAAPAHLRTLPAVASMRQIWLQNFYVDDEALYWREEQNCPPCSKRIISPYEHEARLCQKKQTYWHGYKVHLTETCEADTPNLISHVETTKATDQDNTAVTRIHAALATKGLLPAQHIVDSGYMSAELLVDSQTQHSVDLLGPMRPDVRWQSQDEQAFDMSEFQIDWEKQVVTCPLGKLSRTWRPDPQLRRGKPAIQIRFSKSDCLPCPARALCTKSESGPRSLTILPQLQQEALQSARQRQATDDFKEQYALRSGIEGTIALATDKLRMRRSHYRGIAKTHLQHLLTAAAINLMRFLDWIGQTSRSATRSSHLAALMPAG
jgi:transposase